MKTTVIALVLILFYGSTFADPAFIIDTLPVPETDCLGPQLASSDDGLTMISYVAQGVVTMNFAVTQLVPTHPDPGVPWPAPVTLSSGGGAKLCWSRDGFTAAVSSGPVILLFQSDLAGNWDLLNYEMIDPGGELLGMDLWGAPSDAAGPAVFFTWQASPTPQEPGALVGYMSRSSAGWSAPELVVETTEQWPHPQMTWSTGPAGPWPTIFYLDGPNGNGELMYTTKDLASGLWSEPVSVPGDGVSSPTPLGGGFDVVSPFDLNRHILGLGPQPACPCGSLHHQFFTPGAGWHPAEQITVQYDYFDWPMSPCLGAETDGTVHAFWFQLASSPELEPHQKTLEYYTWDGGGWNQAGDFLADQSGGPLGSRLALDVSPVGFPVLAWTRLDTLDGVPQPEQVWFARPQDPSAVPGEPVPRPELTLRAWPNPFNPRVNLEFELATDGQVKLEIFDARGRLISRLIDGARGTGNQAAVWNGQDAAGRPQPSGVYFAKLVTAQGIKVQKLVLAQ